MIETVLSKPHVFDTNPKAIQQINFTENIHQDGNTSIFLNIEKEKETILDFSQQTVRVL